MRAFLPAIAGCFVLACGGNVVLDGGASGTGGATGTGGLTSAGGAIGAGGAITTGSGGAGGSSCASLVSAFEAALAAATACDPNGPPTECMAEGVGPCGCPVLVNSTGNLAAAEIAAYKTMTDAGCSPSIPCPKGCSALAICFAQCLPNGTNGYQCGEGPG